MSLYEALDRFAGRACSPARGSWARGCRGCRRRWRGDCRGSCASAVWARPSARCSRAGARDLGGAGKPRIPAANLRGACSGVGGAVEPGASGAGRFRQACGRSQQERPPQMELAAAWLMRATRPVCFQRAGLVDDLVRFLLERMFKLVAGDPHLLAGWDPHCSSFAQRCGCRARFRLSAATSRLHRHRHTAADGITRRRRPAAPVANLPLPAAVADFRERHKLPEPH